MAGSEFFYGGGGDGTPFCCRGDTYPPHTAGKDITSLIEEAERQKRQNQSGARDNRNRFAFSSRVQGANNPYQPNLYGGGGATQPQGQYTSFTNSRIDGSGGASRLSSRTSAPGGWASSWSNQPSSGWASSQSNSAGGWSSSQSNSAGGWSSSQSNSGGGWSSSQSTSPRGGGWSTKSKGWSSSSSTSSWASANSTSSSCSSSARYNSFSDNESQSGLMAMD